MSTTPRKTTEAAITALVSVAILYLLAMLFAHEQLEHAWTRLRSSYDLQCWSLTSLDDGLSSYTLTGCGRKAVYTCAPRQVVTPVFPLTYGISCVRTE